MLRSRPEAVLLDAFYDLAAQLLLHLSPKLASQFGSLLVVMLLLLSICEIDL
jgi:hypothetical protein